MNLRSPKERVFQSAGYELGSLLVATPACVWLTGTADGTAAVLVIVLTVATVLWAPLFNAVFDRMEWQLVRRVASDRSRRMRLIHAFALEASDMVISVPILMLIGGLDFGQAVIADLGLLLIYVAYTYVYHRVYDWARPVPHPCPTGNRIAGDRRSAASRC